MELLSQMRVMPDEIVWKKRGNRCGLVVDIEDTSKTSRFNTVDHYISWIRNRSSLFRSDHDLLLSPLEEAQQ